MTAHATALRPAAAATPRATWPRAGGILILVPAAK